MEIIACLGWLILLVIVFAFMCCLMPWWLVLLLFVGIIAFNLFGSNDALFKIQSRPSKPMKNLERVKKEIEERKKAEGGKGTTTHNTNNRVSRTNANIGAGTYYQKNDDFDYDRYIAAQREEQAAYDDFIASLDMDD